MMKSVLGSAMLCLALVLGGAAPANEHQIDLNEVVQFDLLPGWRTDSGRHMTALRVTLAPGWKTYWRAPGEGGIPARFDWEGSGNLQAVTFHWPVPEVFEDNGMRSVGYTRELVLPIEITPRTPGQLVQMRADLEIGVCEYVCIPVSARLSADLAGAGAPDARITGAMRARPDTPQEAGLRSVSCDVDPIKDGLRLTAHLDLPQLGPNEYTVFELPDQTIWVSEASTSRQGATLRAVTEMVPPNGKPFALDRSSVRITVMAAGRAVEIQGCSAR